MFSVFFPPQMTGNTTAEGEEKGSTEVSPKPAETPHDSAV